ALAPRRRFGLTCVLVLTMYHPAVGMLSPFLGRFWVPDSGKYTVALVVSLIVGYILSLVGFVALVNLVYPLLGYLGLLMGIMLAVRWMRNKFTKKRLM